MDFIKEQLFSVQLILSIIWYVFLYGIHYVVEKFIKYTLTIVAVGLVVVMIAIWFAQQPSDISEQSIPLSTTNPYAVDSIHSTLLSSVEIEKSLSELHTLHTVQPSDITTIINIALLYDAQGNDEKSLEFWQKARNIDPNHPIFNKK